MKRSYSILVLAVLIHLSSTAQVKNVIYSIDKAGYQTSYLFGTVHMIPADKLAFSEATIAALFSCRQLVMEADISPENLNAGLLRYVRIPNGGTLDTLLTEKEYRQLDSALIVNGGLGMKAYKYFKPFFIDATLMSSVAPKNAEVVEKVLLDLVSADTTLTISYLETIQEQMCVFDSIPLREQLKYTLLYVQDPDKMNGDYDLLVDRYVNADVEGLDKLINEVYEDKIFTYYLVEKRNKAWVPQLMALMQEQSTFIAVGAGHLGGNIGLLNLLSQQGFTVKMLEQ